MLEGIIFVAGIIVGVVGAVVGFMRLNVGNLNIDRSDPSEAPYLFCELDRPVDTFAHKKYVLMRVTNKNYISHE